MTNTKTASNIATCLSIMFLAIEAFIVQIWSHMEPNDATISTLISGMIVGAIAFVIYMSPTIVGCCLKSSKHGYGMFLINIFFGFTLIGWGGMWLIIILDMSSPPGPIMVHVVNMP